MFREAPHASSLYRKARLPLLIAGALSAFTTGVYAQSATDQTGQTQEVERVTVTGSNIRRTDIETPSPVQVITAEDLKNSGYTTIAQVLGNLTANGQGTLSQSFPQAFAGGASGTSLFGLNTSATLVLIDGHRMAPYALSDDGQRSFVDISSIPFDAVERIEVLKDGASAVYGSDAMAGVVNVILKKSFVGTSVTAEVGTSQEGGGTTQHESIIQGWGNYDDDGYNAYVNLEYRHQDPITYGQRVGKEGAWSETDLTGAGGNNKTPGGYIGGFTSTPATLTPYFFNQAGAGGFSAANTSFFPGCSYALLTADKCEYQNNSLQIEPRTQNLNALASFTKKLGDWKLDIKASVFDSDAEQYPPGPLSAASGGYATFPGAVGPNVGVSAGVAPHLVGPNIPVVGLPNGYYGNPFPSGDAVLVGDIPGAPLYHTEYNTRATRLVADLSGNLAGWDIDTAVGYTQVDTEQTVYGDPNFAAIAEALMAGTFKIGGNSPATNAVFFPITAAEDDSYLTFAEVHANRTLMTLPGGDLGFSTGAEYIQRVLHSPAPSLIAEGALGGNNAFVTGSQDDASFYTELDAPVLKSVELDLAARYDHFNNAGDSTTGKFGFKWTPIQQFGVRGTVGTGFRAPNPAENGTEGNFYLFNQIADPVLCPNGSKTTAGNAINYCQFAPTYYNVGNPNLQPETSTSYTLGFILEPIKGWSSTVDLYDISIRHQIVAIAGSPNNAVRAPATSTLCSDGTPTGTVTCTVNPILYIPSTYENANSTKTSGIQFDTSYKFSFGSFGSLKTDLNWNHEMGYVLTIGGIPYHLAGTHGPFIIGGDTGNPRDRGQFSLTYALGPWEATGTMNYTGPYDLTDPSQGLVDCNTSAAFENAWFPYGVNVPSQYCKVSSFTTTDVTVRYHATKQLTVFGGINNLFNRQPPIDIATYGGGYLPYNPSFATEGAIGRFFNIGMNYKF